MWIRGLSTAIWKRPDIVLARICCVLIMWTVTACVVTDEIEFSDKINMPPQLHSIDPPNDRIETITNYSEKEFTVTLWDPDAEDGDLYLGKVTIIEQRNTGPYILWQSDCPNPTSVLDPAIYEGGVMVTVKCNAPFQLPNAAEQTTILVQVDISDRNFEEIYEDEAKELQVTWTLELYPQNEN